MKKKPFKNYVILAVLIIATVFITLIASNIYLTNNKKVSEFYEISNKVNSDEFLQYLYENPDVIIYISDKYDLTYGEFEKKFDNKLEELNLKENFVYIEKNEINKEFLNQLQSKNNINIDNTPIVIVIIDKTIQSYTYINQSTNVDTFIQYDIFE